MSEEKIFADRNPPKEVPPVIVGNIVFENSMDVPGGYLTATDLKSKKLLWKLKVTDYLIDKDLESDVQDVYFKSMTLSADQKELIIEDEINTRYRVDIAKKSVAILTWQGSVKILEVKPGSTHWKYKVQFSITNSLNRKMNLDRDSVGEGGFLSNNLFEVTADGKKVPYQGDMKKRGPPESFIELKPGAEFKTEIDLSQYYPIPMSAKKVKVNFSHRNHFSPDSFDMISNVAETDFRR